MYARSTLTLALCLGLLAACGEGAQPVDRTVATLEPIRGGLTIGGQPATPQARLAPNDEITAEDNALGRLRLDGGPRFLIGAGAQLAVIDDGAIRYTAGRIFTRLESGEQLTIESERGRFVATNAAFSVENRDSQIEVYVVRGEVSVIASEHRTVVSAGEQLSLSSSGAPQVEPARLWSDWTGGLARPGMGDVGAPAGVGSLEARVPDETGLARWPLVARRLDVRVRIDGDYAVTEVDQVFFNPASETVEGIYRFRVPEEAVLQRFAVDREGQLVDGYVRERAQAQRSYEQQVYRGSTDDPALLVWDAPGAYRARIYPIRAGETRRILIRYAEWLSRPNADAPRLYRYPMGGSSRPPHIQEFSLQADIGDAESAAVRAGMDAQVEGDTVMLRRSDFRPRADFWLELLDQAATDVTHAYRGDHEPPPRAPGSRVIPNEADESDYYFLPLVLPTDLAQEARTDTLDLVIVADISAGTDRSRLELGRSVVESLVAHLDPEDRVAIVTSDLTIRPVGPEEEPELGPASPERLEALLDGLARVPAGGATDLGAAIAAAAELLDPARQSAVVYVGDGAPTVGELGGEGLLERMARIPNPVRLYAVGVGSSANLDLLATLTRGAGLALRVDDRRGAAEASLDILAHAARPIARRVTVDLGPGIDNAFPRGPASARSAEAQSTVGPVDVVLGQVLPIVGRVRENPPTTVRVTGIIGGQEFTREISVDTVSADDATDLRLRWASERLRQLLLQGEGREAVAELGTRCGLITPFTSYYVPSAREMREAGHSSLFLDQPLLLDEERSQGINALGALLGVVTLPLALTGCRNEDAVTQTQEDIDRLLPSLPTSAEPAASTPTTENEESEVATADSADRSPGMRHRGEEGQMGRVDARRSDNRFGIRGPTDEAEPAPTATPGMPRGAAEAPTKSASRSSSIYRGAEREVVEDALIDRDQAIEHAKRGGVLSALEAAGSTGSAAPTEPFGRDTALGNDPENALGALMGNKVGDNFGEGGLGLRGTGRGGGGIGEGTIGLGNLNTIGHGGGGGSGSGYGRGAGGLRGRRASIPSIRTGSASVHGSLSKEVIRRYIRRHINQIRYCYEQQLARRPDLAGNVSVRFVISPTGQVTTSSVASSTLGNAPAEQCVARAIQRISFPQPSGGGVVVVTYPFRFQSSDDGGSAAPARSERSPRRREPERPTWVSTTTTTTVTTHVSTWNEGSHRRRHCSDAANQPIDDRRALWRERIQAAGSIAGWLNVYRRAIRQCEAPTWRDRRALLSEIARQAGSVARLIEVHRVFQSSGAQDYFRSLAFQRVRTPDDLRRVREYFGVSSAVDWELIEQLLERTRTVDAKIRLLRQLLGLYPRGRNITVVYPNSFELKLRLLSALEEANRLTEARRLAHQLRSDPLADAGVRTAVGEMYLRQGDEAEARRVFSEIVEFAPFDAAARRRLGDLYRAHGWFEDAYRQYQTLAQIRPDDPGVLLLLAQAAAGAGRIDEAIRLEQRLAETAEPGAAGGIARVAILWSSVRFAKMRAAAREAGDEERLEALIRRMRRSGVLREAGQMRVSLTWSHPDAGISLWVAHPGLGLTRPTDITPEFGIEAFDLAEIESGAYRIEVRRQSSDQRTPVEAELVIVLNEGQEEERIIIETLRFEGEQQAFAWSLEGGALSEAPLSDAARGRRASR